MERYGIRIGDKKIILERKIKTLLIDSYQVTERYLAELTKLTHTIYIDDVNAFHYLVSAIICYTNYYEKFNYKSNCRDIELYEGLQYVPLRKEFSKCQVKEIKEKVGNILFLSGGSDNYHILKGILENINLEKYEQVHIICGKYNVDYEELELKYKNSSNIYIHKAVDNMKHYMEQADLVIMAGGSTLYELCAVGTPAISYSFVDNQLDNDIRTDNIFENIKIYLEKYYLDEALRREKSTKMQELVGGNGARRIAEIILKKYAKHLE